jgi:uncharacterized membrane protein
MKKQIIGVVTLLLLDIIWVSTFMNTQYQNMVPKIQCGVGMTPNLTYAAMSYFLMVIGLVVFVLPNINKDNLLMDSLLYGGLFGVVLYGVYDLTAAAVINDWDMKLGLIDIIWGGFVMFASAMVGGYFSDS